MNINEPFCEIKSCDKNSFKVLHLRYIEAVEQILVYILRSVFAWRNIPEIPN